MKDTVCIVCFIRLSCIVKLWTSLFQLWIEIMTVICQLISWTSCKLTILFFEVAGLLRGGVEIVEAIQVVHILAVTVSRTAGVVAVTTCVVPVRLQSPLLLVGHRHFLVELLFDFQVDERDEGFFRELVIEPVWQVCLPEFIRVRVQLGLQPRFVNVIVLLKVVQIVPSALRLWSIFIVLHVCECWIAAVLIICQKRVVMLVKLLVLRLVGIRINVRIN